MKKLQQICEKYDQRQDVSELKVLIGSSPENLDFRYQSENVSPIHFIASSTKMMSAELVFRLCEQGTLDLQDIIAKHLDSALSKDLDTRFGAHFSKLTTIEMLLRHKAGLPDYHLRGELKGLSNVEKDSLAHPGWSLEKALELSSKSKLSSGNSKVVYSGLNYRLIQEVVSSATGLSGAEALKKYVFDPLGMNSTFLFDTGVTRRFSEVSQLFVGKERYFGVHRLATVGFEGAIVSSLEDTMKFMNHFFSEHSNLAREAAKSGPFEKSNYGIKMSMGLMRFRIPVLGNQRFRFLELYGHSGMTGHQMFHIPKLDKNVILTPNQIGDPDLGFQILLKILGQIV